jgi:hypothetical protein
MTHSYPRHVASDKLYESISENIDKFVEVYIGKYGRPKLSKKDLGITLLSLNDTSIIDFIDNTIAFFIKDILKHIKDSDVDLLNIRDEIVADLNQTKYLFTLH